MVKTTKGGKVMNPTDAYRKDLRKKEIKRNKKERKKVREVGILKKDPDQLKDQIQKLEMMKAEGALDKARKHKKRQLEDMLSVVMKKRREYEDKMKEKGETPVMFSHLGLPRRRTSAEEDERAKQLKPEDSVYYHPTLNPTGAPPPGKPPMYKSSIGPRIPLSEASSSAGGASSSADTELDDDALPAPPPPPPLPNSDDLGSAEAFVTPESLPLPPPPPMPPGMDSSLPILPPPPPPPGPPPPKDHLAMRPPPPPQSNINQPAQPPPPGTMGAGVEDNKSTGSEGITSEDSIPQLPPPPPPGLASSASSESNVKTRIENKDTQQLVLPPPPPPPPRQHAPIPPGFGVPPSLHPDMLPPGIHQHYMPDMQHPLVVAAAPPGMVPMIPRPPFGPPPMMRPPLPPGPPPSPFLMPDDLSGFRPPTVHKPSYVKSAAPTVVKRPLAQHTPELTSMVPASVRVKRETATTKAKPKPSPSTTPITSHRPIAPTIVKPKSLTASAAPSAAAAPKSQSIDDSYSAFLEDMKALGALDS